MRTYLILFLLLCGLPVTLSYGQEVPDTQTPAAAQPTRSSFSAGDDPELPEMAWTHNEAAVTPSVRSIQSSEDVDVDRYSGTLHVRIPLYELQTSGGKLPIALNYQGSGIRLDDMHTAIGLGWDLSAGGRITRVVQGNVDNFSHLKDTYNLYDFKTDTFYKRFFDTSDYDSQPDLYSFSIPGMSGSFLIDADLRAQTCPYQPVDIRIDTLANEFTLYDPQGVCYRFGSYTESDARIMKTDYSGQSHWQTIGEWSVTEIIYPNGSKVDITYQETGFTAQSFSGTTMVRKTGNRIEYIIGDEKKGVYTRRDTRMRHYPLKIRYKEQEIDFVYDQSVGRRPGGPQWILTRIEAVTDGTARRTICFERDTFPNGNYRLREVYEQAQVGHRRPIASFTYYEDPVMPERMHKGFDHWGYWNQDGEELLGCPFVPIGGIYPEFGTNRTSDLERTRAQSLRSIVYPAGGSKEFIYGLHAGRERDKPMMRVCGGLRVERIIERDGTGSRPAEYRYTYNGGIVYADRFNYVTSISNEGQHVEYYDISSRCLSPLNDRSALPVVYSSVTEHLPNGSSIQYDYVPLEEFDDLYPEKYLITPDTVRFLGYETEEDLPKTSRAWGRNLLRQRTQYDAAGRIVGRTAYQYLVDTAAAVRIPGLVPYRSQVDGHRKNCLARYFHICCPVLLKSRIEYAGKTNPYSRTDYVYNDRHLPTHEIKRYADGTRVTSYTKYNHEYYNKINFEKGPVTFPFLPIEHLVYRNGKLQQAALTIYRTARDRNQHERVLQLKEPQATIDSAAFRISDRTFRRELLYDSRYTDAIVFDHYDSEGNMTCYHKADGRPMSIVYRQGRSMPLAYVANARYAPAATERVNEVWFDDFERDDFYSWLWPDYGTVKSGVRGRLTTPLSIPVGNFKPGPYILSYWYQTRASERWLRHRSRIEITDAMQTYTVEFPAEAVVIDDASLLPPNATLKSQVAIPGLGTISETDARGRTRYYEYNGFGLPTRVLDNERQPIKTYSYDHYNPNLTLPTL